MTNFQQDVIKLVIDKALLGVVAAVFGYYLSRLLENHRAKNAHRLFVVQQRIESMKAMLALVGEDHKYISDLHEMVGRVLERHRCGEKAGQSDIEAGRRYINFYNKARSELMTYFPLLTFDLAEALIRYMSESRKICLLIKGDTTVGLPSREDLNRTYLEFGMAYQKVVLGGELWEDAMSEQTHKTESLPESA